MRTVMKAGVSQGVPRILVRISGQDRNDKVEKKITTNDGKEIVLILNALTEDRELKKEELAVQIGEVIGLGPGCEGYQIGDMVLMDYTVDSDEQYLVKMEEADKIVSVPCRTTYHPSPMSITSYGMRKSETEFIYTGERNMLIWDAGDVDQLGLVYAVVRATPEGAMLIPNEYWVFCEHVPERSENMEAVNGILAYRQNDDTHVTRKVEFCSPEEKELEPGDQILAVRGSAIPLSVHGIRFDVVGRLDIFAKDETEIQN